MKSFFLCGHSDSYFWFRCCLQWFTQLRDHIDSRVQVILQKFTVKVLIYLQPSHKPPFQRYHWKILWLSEFSRFTADLKIKNFHSNSFCSLGCCLMHHSHTLATALSFFQSILLQSSPLVPEDIISPDQFEFHLPFTGRYLNTSCFEYMKSQFISCSINRTGKLVDLQDIC